MDRPSQSSGPVDNHRSQISRLNTLPLNAVRLRQSFWQSRQEMNHQISLHHAYRQLAQNGAIESFRRCANRDFASAGKPGGHEGHDTDIYKWLEAVAWELARSPDEQLSGYVNEIVPWIVAAQAEDGYLVTPIQLHHPQKKWADLNFGHEMYCAGHLIQAAVALQRALGDDRLLQVACRFADHIDSVFGPGKRSGTCGHPEIETALVELYRLTGSQRYLQLARFLLDERGQNRLSGLASYGPEYHQDHAPLRAARQAVGHAVRQTYLATGAADFVMETGDAALLDTLNALWQDINGSKAHITGGMGARFEGEAFGDAYELPTDQCYCETCAAIGDWMWNWRMLLISGNSRFADHIERALYNAVLCSPALDGSHYFYVNPLMLRESQFLRLSTNRPDEVSAAAGRPAWHGVACCPPNVMRMMASLSHYFATVDRAGRIPGLQIHQYSSGVIDCELGEAGPVEITLQTDYPWQGVIELTVAQPGLAPWALSLRMPGWCESFALEINGQPAGAAVNLDGYLVLERAWQAGDRVRLELNMPPVLMNANPRVDALRGCAAIQRGPLVYCFESHDQPENINLLDICLDARQPLQVEWRDDLLNGVMVVYAQGCQTTDAWGSALYQPYHRRSQAECQPLRLAAIPYYAWGNRGLKTMRVWTPLLE